MYAGPAAVIAGVYAATCIHGLPSLSMTTASNKPRGAELS